MNKRVAFLAAGLMVAGCAEESRAIEVTEFAKVGDWTVNQYTGSEAAGGNPSCAAVKLADHINGLRVERIAEGYWFGFNGMSREEHGETYPVSFWFDEESDNPLSGDARFLHDAADELDDWLSHFHAIEDETPIAEAIAGKSSLTFAFESAGNRTGNDTVTVTHTLDDSAAALQALEECFAQASGQPLPATPSPQSSSSVEPEAPQASTCPDDGPRFEGSGICMGRAINYLDHANLDGALMDGCEWVMNEAPLPGGDYLLYLAAKCDGHVTTLELAGGAASADLNIAQSGLARGDAGGKVGTVFALTDGTAEENIFRRAMAQVEDNAEQAKCEVRATAPDYGYGPDAYIVDYNATERAKLSDDEPHWLCGDLGTHDSASFWRVFGGYAWHFDMGQDAWWDFDPSSLIVVEADRLPRQD